MNRYAAAGLLADVRAGKRVLVVCGSSASARDAFGNVTDQGLHDGEKSFRSYGHERIEAPSGGWVRFRSVHGRGHRGVTADVVLLDTAVSDEEMADLMACVACVPHGEVLRT